MNLQLTPNDLVDLAGGRGDPVLRRLVASQEKELHQAKETIQHLQQGLAEAHDRIAELGQETANHETRIRDLERKGPAAAAVSA